MVTQIPQEQTQVATVELHNRTYRHALDKVQALLQDAVHPANIQSYLSHWGTWWYPVAGLKKYELIHRWLLFAEYCKQQCKQSQQLGKQQVATWLGCGLLLGTPAYEFVMAVTFTNPSLEVSTSS